MDKLIKDVVSKEAYVTTSIISEKLKINASLAREAINALREEQKLAPLNEYHSRYCCFVKTANFVAPVQEKKEEVKKGGQQQAKGKQAKEEAK